MTNKEQLRDVNNPRLREIKTTAVGLPTQESMKQGLYVWKKSVPGLNVIGTLSGGTATRDMYTLNVDASFTANDLIGASLYGTGASPIGYFNEEGTLTIGNSKVVYNYNQSTKVLGINMLIGAETITIKKDKIFVSYVISDDQNAYPDGGTKDGYYYEKIQDGIPLSFLGCTKFAVDKITFSKNTSAPQTFNHSLGEMPKFAILVAPNIQRGNNYFICRACAVSERANSTNTDVMSSGAGIVLYPSGSTAISVTDSSTALTVVMKYSNKVQYVANSSSYYFKAGEEYLLITMA